MKFFLALIIAITLIPKMALAIDTEIAIFDDEKNALVKMYKNFGGLCEQDMPDCSKYFEELIKLQILADKLERIVFIHVLNDKTASKDLRSWSEWVSPSLFIANRKLEEIIKLNPEYDELYKAARKQELRVRMYSSGQGKLVERKSDEIEKIKLDYYADLASNKQRWETLKNKAN